MTGQKMRMVMALKLIMAKGLLRMPEKIAAIWSQLASWRMPDTKLRQDVASTIFMAAFIIQRLYSLSDVPTEEEGDVVGADQDAVDRFVANRAVNRDRHSRIKR